MDRTGGRGVEKGLADNGQALILPLLVAREFHELTFVFNGALEKPIHDPEREMTAEFGAAVGRAFTRKVAAMIELRRVSSTGCPSPSCTSTTSGQGSTARPAGGSTRNAVRRFGTTPSGATPAIAAT